jgi:glycosyltransferase involved in cell wall biosynthesis
VLHVVGSLDPGGIETWLARILGRQLQEVDVDFIALGGAPGLYAEAAVRQGAGVISDAAGGRASYIRAIGSTLTSRKYDIVHSHVHHFNGLVLSVARYHRVAMRIAHAHNDTRLVDGVAPETRRLYIRVMRGLTVRNATTALACSGRAAESLFADTWGRFDARAIVPYAVDLGLFERQYEASNTRSDLGIPSGALMLIHVGRFVEQKNQAFLVELVKALREVSVDVRLVLVGDGPTRESIERSVTEAHLEAKVVFAGVRTDVAALLSASDVFVFPSLSEGLGLAVVEAQTAGLPCVVSHGVPEEAEVVTGLVSRLDLDEGPRAWARAVTEVASADRPNPSFSLAQVGMSRYNVEESAEALMRVYRGDRVAD